MRTPAGKECRYFYGDYYRGREKEECRLLAATPAPQRWSRDVCFACPVPDILLANACPHLTLEGHIERPFPFLRRIVRVSAHCNKTLQAVDEPRIGCGECHPVPSIFMDAFDDPDPVD